MTKKLEEILNLPNVKEAFKEVDAKEKDKESKNTANGKSANLDPQTAKNLEKSYAEFDKIAAALPQVKGLGELSMLRNAIDAKSNKIDKKLKMVELQLKKQKIDKDGDKDTGTIEAQDGFVISDRNELMKKLLKKD
jgi:hypothetical protein